MMQKPYLPVFVQPEVLLVEEEGKEIEAYDVDVTGYEYVLCDQFSSKMYACEKKGVWGSGLANTKADSCKSQRIGNCGEMAFGKLFHLRVNFVYRKFGVHYDFIVHGDKVDVKTMTYNYHKALIRFSNDQGQRVPLHCKSYVFAYLVAESREDHYARIRFVGYQLRSFIQKQTIRKSGRGVHKNYESPLNQLNPFSVYYASYWEIENSKRWNLNPL